VQADILRVFIGYDPRQPLAYNVLQHSIIKNSSIPVAITPLVLSQLPLKRQGLTQFTYSRFLVPWLCGFKGKAVFMDADMVVTGDIAELFDCIDQLNAVSVMKEQPKFEWASVMGFSCDMCMELTPEFIEDERNTLFDLAWAGSIGEIPPEWNHCVRYMEPQAAKLYHYTMGLPCWPETAGAAEDPAWIEAYQDMQSTVTWKELMGNSVHAKETMKRYLGDKYGLRMG